MSVCYLFPAVDLVAESLDAETNTTGVMASLVLNSIAGADRGFEILVLFTINYRVRRNPLCSAPVDFSYVIFAEDSVGFRINITDGFVNTSSSNGTIYCTYPKLPTLYTYFGSLVKEREKERKNERMIE